MVSNNVYLLTLSSSQSGVFNIRYGKSINPFHSGNSATLTISSSCERNLTFTNFVEIWKFPNKTVKIDEAPVKVEQKGDFYEPNQKVTSMTFRVDEKERENIQKLVYVVGDDCKKYLTRAGETRIDYIQFCDSSCNPIEYSKSFEVRFIHSNHLAVIEPYIVRKEGLFGLKWTPTIMGHYYIYIDSYIINPDHEIGVCAAQFDYSKTKVTAPKVQKMAFGEESEFMLDLRDEYGNIYSQLEEDILGDELLIHIEASQQSQNMKVIGYMDESIKVVKEPIDKYGLKKIKFSFGKRENKGKIKIVINVFLNAEHVIGFRLEVEGYSLQERKNSFSKQIQLKYEISNMYMHPIVIQRSCFLEDLMKIAEKNMHINMKIIFSNEQGVDAGGLKRQFYDMIGTQMKMQKNTFFQQTNEERMEYFLNPQILKNKKKCVYMQAWGKYVANSILNSYLLGINFSPVFIKMVYGEEIDYRDMLDIYPQRRILLTASPQQIQSFSVTFSEVIDPKKNTTIELKKGGNDIEVTADNLHEYLELFTRVMIAQRYQEIVEAFRRGFNSVIDLQIIKKWIKPSEFWCLTAGVKQINAEVIFNCINFQGYSVNVAINKVRGWFRRYLTEADRTVLTGFLKFSTGSSSLDFSLNNKIVVTFRDEGQDPKRLPVSHTCWRELVVPKYKTYEIMKNSLNIVFLYCCEGFGNG